MPNGDAFAHAPVFADLLRVMYVSRLRVHLFGNLAQREFAEGNEIAAAKEILSAIARLSPYCRRRRGAFD